MINFDQLVKHQGNYDLFQVIQMAIVSNYNNYPIHFHVEGLRGTGKTTIIRSAKQKLPYIERIKGCIYNCDPQRPHCPNHINLSREEITEIGTEKIPMPFLEISHSAKIGTVAGSIDLGKLTQVDKPEAALLPGIIPRAHRGIIFVDEINRLADTSPELVDVLLDVMGTKPGRIQIEESGLPTISMPVSVSVWAASNPDEDPGPLEEIRRQLADRFDYTIQMGRPKEISVILEMLNKNKWNKVSKSDNGFDHQELNKEYLEQLEKQCQQFSQVEFGLEMQKKLAKLYLDYDLESMRALEAIQIGGQIIAALKLKPAADYDDLKTVLPWSLRHRVDPLTLGKIINDFNQLEEYGQEEDKENSLRDKVNSLKTKKDQKNKHYKISWGWLDKSVFLATVINWFRKVLFKNSRISEQTAPNPAAKTSSNCDELDSKMNFINPLQIDLEEFPANALPLASLEGKLVSTAEELEAEAKNKIKHNGV